jgi:AcrR family transcriptional regulator
MTPTLEMSVSRIELAKDEFRKLQPRWCGLTREQVVADQRLRLRAAMIEEVIERGYAATSVKYVLARAKTNRKVFYEQFASKQDCFLSTYDYFTDGAVQRISAAYRQKRGWRRKLHAAFEAYTLEVVASPKAARLALVEVLAAGPVAIARLDRTRQTFEKMIATSLSEGHSGVELPPLLVQGTVCGIERVTRRHLLAGTIEELPGLAEELCAWVLSYRSAAANELRIAVPRGGRLRSRRAAEEETDRIRLLRSAAKIAADEGYASLTAGRIARDAGVSKATFDALFKGEKGKDQCFFDALRHLGLEALVQAGEPARCASDPAIGVQRGIAALMEYLAYDPVLAQIAFVEVFAAGPAAIETREWVLSEFKRLLVKLLPEADRPSDVVAEATVGAVWGIIHHRITHGSPRELPYLSNHAAYLALTPALGAETAVKKIALAT